MSIWSYAVHGRSPAFFNRADKLDYSETESALKEQAIRCHKTQLKLSSRRFLAYATRPELFLKLNSHDSTVADGPIRSVSREADMLRLNFVLTAKPMRLTGATLFVLGHNENGTVRCLRAAVPVRSSVVEMFDCLTSERLQLAQYRGDTLAGEFAIPIDNFSPAHALFVKLERRSWFFDEAGWVESLPANPDISRMRMSTTRCTRAEVLS
jgi:hypothetical protein